jgi:succinylarginine dihydrolase
MSEVEVNFDGLVGPTHHYAGLARGNLASQAHGHTVSSLVRRRWKGWRSR